MAGQAHAASGLVTEGQQQVAQAGGKAAQRVVAGTARRDSMARQIGSNDGVAMRERLEYAAPVLLAARHPVDQQQDRPFAATEIAHLPTVHLHRLEAHVRQL